MPSLNPSRHLRPQQRAALWALACVLCAHLLLLGWWPVAPGPGWRAVKTQPLQVRQIFQAQPGRVVSMVNDKTAPPPAAPQALPRPAAGAARAERAERAQGGAGAAPKPLMSAAAAASASAPAVASPPSLLQAGAMPAVASPADAESVTTIAPSPEPGGDSVPVFATQLPAPFEARYSVQRGLVNGRAELRWQVRNDRYELSLRTSAFGAQALSWASVGGIDANGMAPERYTESRRNKELRAVNFQRDSGRITFSGPQLQYPLVAGAQDRLGWMVQLPAVLQANPGLAVVGAQVPLFVVGARGDAEVWAFQVVALESVDLPDGSAVKALHLKREPRRAYDSQTDVWVDPARHHLPVRIVMRVRATGEGTEFLLDGLRWP
jgi:Protein of unknown function (DUF3108)